MEMKKNAFSFLEKSKKNTTWQKPRDFSHHMDILKPPSLQPMCRIEASWSLPRQIDFTPHLGWRKPPSRSPMTVRW